MKYLILLTILSSPLAACVTVNKGNGTYTVDGSDCVRYNPGNCISHDDSNGRDWFGCLSEPGPQPFPPGGKGPGPRIPYRPSKDENKTLRGVC